jgi:hypothetical protein
VHYQRTLCASSPWVIHTALAAPITLTMTIHSHPPSSPYKLLSDQQSPPSNTATTHGTNIPCFAARAPSRYSSAFLNHLFSALYIFPTAAAACVDSRPELSPLSCRQGCCSCSSCSDPPAFPPHAQRDTMLMCGLIWYTEERNKWVDGGQLQVLIQLPFWKV